jgi:hypothetical protein
LKVARTQLDAHEGLVEEVCNGEMENWRVPKEDFENLGETYIP